MSAIYFIDSRVSNYLELIRLLPSDVSWFAVPADVAGLDFVAAALSEASASISEVHIISHGNDGSILLGQENVDSATLSDSTESLETISNSVAPDSELLLYGCGVAETEVGQTFVDHLAIATGAKVAASVDSTGSNGDSRLEYSTGDLGAEVLNLSAAGITLDNISGTDNSEMLNGSTGDDWISDLGGNDTAFGGSGDDTFWVGTGDNLLDGGAGFDTARFGSLTSAIYANLTTGVASGTDGQNTLINIERLSGTAYADTLIGDSGKNWFWDSLGNDTIDGGEGEDLVFYNENDTSSTGIKADLRYTDANGFSVVIYDGKVDYLKSIESLHGSQAGDIIYLSNADGYIFGEGGDDKLYGGAGGNNFHGGSGNDTIDGGAGWDKISFRDDYEWMTNTSQSRGVDVDLTTGVVLDNYGGTDTVTNIENVSGSSLNDRIVGNETDNTLWGYDGDDTLEGLAGNDRLLGEAGRDVLIGGAGNDTLVGGDGHDWLDGGDGDDFIDASFFNTSDDNDGVRAGLGNDVVIGNADKYWNGRGLFLTYDTVEAGGLVVTIYADGFGYISSGAGTVNTSFSYVNNLVLTAGNDSVVGADNNVHMDYSGLAGNDTFDGGSGEDHLMYDRDFDNGGTSGITINFATGTAIDGFGDTDTFTNIEAMRGTQFADLAIGNANQDYVFYQTMAGNDTVVGSDGYDILKYWAEVWAGGSGGINARLDLGTVVDTFGDTDTVSSIDRVEATDGDDYIQGGDLSETFAGRGGNDTLFGALGNDRLFGHAGDDSIDGGEGNDEIEAGGGRDTVVGGAGDDKINANDFEATDNGAGSIDDTFDGGEGWDQINYLDSDAGVTINLEKGFAEGDDIGRDTLSNFERVQGTRFNDLIIGSDNSADANLSGRDAVESFSGYGGQDTIIGQEGSDFLWLAYETSALTIDLSKQFEAQFDVDRNFLGVQAGVEAAVTGGMGDIYLSGFEAISGSNYSDFITGSSSDDTFVLDWFDWEGHPNSYNGGADTVYGGEGIDSVAYDWVNYDIFTNFTGIYVNLASNLVIDQAGNIDRLYSIETIYGTSKQDRFFGSDFADDFTGYGGDDLFYESAGNDTFDGGEGNDVVTYSGISTDYQVTSDANGKYVIKADGSVDTLIGIESINFDGGNIITFTEGDDRVLSNHPNGDTSADEIFDLGGGNDTLEAWEGGSDLIIAGSGDDLIWTDAWYFNWGDNSTIPTDRKDTIEGGDGFDIIRIDTWGGNPLDGQFLVEIVSGAEGSAAVTYRVYSPDDLKQDFLVSLASNGSGTVSYNYSDPSDPTDAPFQFLEFTGVEQLEFNDLQQTIFQRETSEGQRWAGFTLDLVEGVNQGISGDSYSWMIPILGTSGNDVINVADELIAMGFNPLNPGRTVRVDGLAGDDTIDFTGVNWEVEVFDSAGNDTYIKTDNNGEVAIRRFGTGDDVFDIDSGRIKAFTSSRSSFISESTPLTVNRDAQGLPSSIADEANAFEVYWDVGQGSILKEQYFFNPDGALVRRVFEEDGSSNDTIFTEIEQRWRELESEFNSDDGLYKQILALRVDFDTQELYYLLTNNQTTTTVTDTAQSNWFYDTSNSEHIIASDGDDYIAAWAGGNDTLDGGAGNDEIWVDGWYFQREGSPHSLDVVHGGEGNDVLRIDTRGGDPWAGAYTITLVSGTEGSGSVEYRVFSADDPKEDYQLFLNADGSGSVQYNYYLDDLSAPITFLQFDGIEKLEFNSPRQTISKGEEYHRYARFDFDGTGVVSTAADDSMAGVIGEYQFEGHDYYLFDYGYNYNEALVLATSLGGYILEIDSEAENNFILDTVMADSGSNQVRIGLTDTEYEGLWLTSDGRLPVYTDWGSYEPNDFSDGQDYAYIESNNFFNRDNDNGGWDDAGDWGPRLVVELGGQSDGLGYKTTNAENAEASFDDELLLGSEISQLITTAHDSQFAYVFDGVLTKSNSNWEAQSVEKSQIEIVVTDPSAVFTYQPNGELDTGHQRVQVTSGSFFESVRVAGTGRDVKVLETYANWVRTGTENYVLFEFVANLNGQNLVLSAVVYAEGDLFSSAEPSGTDWGITQDFQQGGAVPIAGFGAGEAISIATDWQHASSSSVDINAWIYGAGADDTLIGGDASDTLQGGTGNDVVYGEFGADSLSGEEGNDSIYGGEGDDTLKGGDGDDLLDGGHGNDRIVGRNGADYLFGGSGDDHFMPEGESTVGLADDTIDGGEGRDTVSYSNQGVYGQGTARVVVDLAAGTARGESIGFDTLMSIEDVVGTDFNDFLSGNDEDNAIAGLAGNDVIRGGAGNDELKGGEGNDLIEGQSGNDFIEDGAGNDTIYGGSGNDTINNVGGTDTFDGGDGVDTLISDVTQFAQGDFILGFNAVSGTHGRLNSDVGQDTVVSIENFKTIGNIDAHVIGGSEDNVFITDGGNDSLEGGAGNDELRAGLGDDSLSGGIGDDILHADRGRDVFDGGTGRDRLIADVTFATNSSRVLEVNLDLQNGYQALRGAYTTDPSEDPGYDRFIGIEEYVFKGVFNLEVSGSEADNFIQTDQGNDVIAVGAGNDTVLSGGGNDFVYGEAGDDLLILSGSGTTTLDGGDGVDTFRIALNHTFPDVTIDLVNGIVGASADLYNPLSDFLISLENIEASGVNFTVVGDAADNKILTGSMNDTITGGAGSDIIDAGQGIDTAVYEGAFSNYSIALLGTDLLITDLSDSSVDTLRNVEYLQFSDRSSSITDILDGPVAPGTQVVGKVYHWSAHYLLPDVEIAFGGLTSTYSGAAEEPYFSVSNIRDEGGVLKADIVLNTSGNAIDNFTFDLSVPEGVAIGLTASSELTGNGWLVSKASIDGGLAFGGFSISSPLSSDQVIAEISLSGDVDLASLVLGISNGSIGYGATESLLDPYEIRSGIFESSTTQSGEYYMDVTENYSASTYLDKPITSADEGRVVSAADALAALKIAVGLNPNLDSNGEGFSTSAYQYLASDINEDGRVSAADALAILKMAVRLEGSAEREWVFVREDTELSDTSGNSLFNRSDVDWSVVENAIDTSQDTEVHFVGLLKGDVNGSWSDDTLSQLDVSYFDSFANTEQWWVV